MKKIVLLTVCCTTLNAAPHLSEMIVRGSLGAFESSSISKNDIKKKQHHKALSLFNSHPSLEVKNSGGVTSLSIRGTNSAHNIVMLNGLVVNDPSSNNQFDFSALTSSDIQKIEVITGAQALYYGNGALGGVIKITTTKAKKGSQAKGRFEIGNFAERTTHLTATHRAQNFGILGALNTGRSGQKTRWNHHHHTHNADFHSTTSGSLYLDAQPTTPYSLELYIQGEEAKTHLNNFINGKLRATGDYTQRYANRLALKNNVSLFQGRWHQSLTLGHQNNRRKTIANTNRTYISQRNALDYKSTFDISDWCVLENGFNYTRESDTSSHIPGKTFDHKGVRSKLTFDIKETAEIFMAGRLDKHERFSAHPTWQLGLSWEMTPNTTLKTSTGTGFKAPSIQTFIGSHGLQHPNPNAKPEKSFLWDVTLSHRFYKNKSQINISYFLNHIKHVLAWDFTTRTMINRNERTIKGLELSLHHIFNPKWQTKASLTYLRVFDREPASRALNTPPYKVALSLTYAPTKKLSFFTEIVHKSRQLDYAQKRLNALTNVRLGGQYQWHKNIEIFGRLENALNQKIEESYGFGRRGLGAFVGVTVKT